jgi:hypothetical protein
MLALARYPIFPHTTSGIEERVMPSNWALYGEAAEIVNFQVIPSVVPSTRVTSLILVHGSTNSEMCLVESHAVVLILKIQKSSAMPF